MLKPETSILVIVDVQGRLATLMWNKDAFLENVVRMIRGAKVLEIPILWNEQLPDKLGSTVSPVREALTGLEPLVKNTFSCCGNLAFMKALRESRRTQVLLVGMESHVCVYQTAMDLLQSRYEVHVVADAVSSRTAANRHIGIDKINDAGGKITSVETALFEMLRLAEGENFKRVIQIVK